MTSHSNLKDQKISAKGPASCVLCQEQLVKNADQLASEVCETKLSWIFMCRAKKKKNNHNTIQNIIKGNKNWN